MTRKIVVLVVSALGWCGMAAESHALQMQNDQLAQQILGKTQEKLGQARTAQADILSPDVFARAFKKFNEAKEDLKRGRSLADINSKVSAVNTDLDAAMNTAKVGKVALATALQARDDALNINAPQYAPEKYLAADKAFLDAARQLEGGDMNGAKKKGAEAERLMREAELQAIKGSIIGSVRSKIEEAKQLKVDRLAPITFDKAQRLFSEAENILNTNRYNASTAREKAEAADYEIRHATSLAEQIQRLKADERSWEKRLLEFQQQLTAISKELDFTPQFAEGNEKAVNDVRQTAKSLREERRDLSAEVNRLNGRMDELSRELNSIRETQAGLESQLEKEKRKQQERQRREDQIKAVANIFEPAEARVLREGDNLRIRLVGLTFQSGKAIILPQHFSLLTKLQRAIREFPNANVVIEGHTDAIGNDDVNQRLSTERANAVQQYLIANMGLTAERIQAVGYGESTPIANNESEDGRAQNRRIDAVIAIPPL